MPRPTRQEIDEINSVLEEGTALLRRAEELKKIPDRTCEGEELAARGDALVREGYRRMDSFGPREQPRERPRPPARLDWLPAIPYDSPRAPRGGSAATSRKAR